MPCFGLDTGGEGEYRSQTCTTVFGSQIDCTVDLRAFYMRILGLQVLCYLRLSEKSPVITCQLAACLRLVPTP